MSLLDHPDAQTLLTEVLGDPGFGEGSGSPRQDRPVASRTSRKTPSWVFVALKKLDALACASSGYAVERMTGAATPAFAVRPFTRTRPYSDRPHLPLGTYR